MNGFQDHPDVVNASNGDLVVGLGSRFVKKTDDSDMDEAMDHIDEALHCMEVTARAMRKFRYEDLDTADFVPTYLAEANEQVSLYEFFAIH